MISANVITPWADIDKDLGKFTHMEEWCIENIGTCAGAKDQVDNIRPWYIEFKFGVYNWYFANAEDATLFRLKWP